MKQQSTRAAAWTEHGKQCFVTIRLGNFSSMSYRNFQADVTDFYFNNQCYHVSLAEYHLHKSKLDWRLCVPTFVEHAVIDIAACLSKTYSWAKPNLRIWHQLAVSWVGYESEERAIHPSWMTVLGEFAYSYDLYRLEICSHIAHTVPC